MPNNSLLFTFDRFSGMNNVEESFRIPIARDAHYRVISDMNEIENLDIDNSMALSTRPGSDLELSGTDVHSLWADGLICLFVDNGTLYRLTPQYTAITVSVIGNSRVSYALWNDRAYLTNGSYIGYFLDDAVTALPDPGVTYKLPLPAGKFIAYYRGRLYVAKGKVIYISDPLCDHYDIRTGFRVFSGDITMLVAADKGLYVSDGATWFVPGAEPEEFQKIKIQDADAIPYTAISVSGEKIGDGLPGNYVLWVSTKGICMGDGNGTVKNLTRSRYSMPSYMAGAAAIRNINETVHYIAALE